MSYQPTILVPLNRGHFIRLILYSGVIERLAALNCRVVLFTRQGVDSSLRQLISHPNVVFDELPLNGARFEYRWEMVYRYLFQNMLPTTSSEARLDWIRQSDPRRYSIITRLGPHRLGQLRKIWLTARQFILPAKQYQAIFDRYSPDLVVVGTAGMNSEEYLFLHLAERFGVRSLCALQSWDLLTTKGDVLSRPQKMLVWNDENVRETVNLFGYSPKDVLALGVPHFDLYFKTETFVPRADWLSRYGFVPERALILVTPGALHIHRNLTEVIEALVDGMNTGAFVKDIQVLVRPHPSVYMGQTPGQGTESDLLYYESLHPFVKANRPVKATDSLYDNAAISEMKVLANNLHHANVLIDFYGTVSVEASMINTPIVYADVKSSFAAATEAPTTSVNGIDYRKYAHLKAILEKQGARTAYNREELYSLLNLYLENPELDRGGRRKVAEAFCGELDGNAAERVALTLGEYARGNWNAESKQDSRP